MQDFSHRTHIHINTCHTTQPNPSRSDFLSFQLYLSLPYAGYHPYEIPVSQGSRNPHLSPHSGALHPPTSSPKDLLGFHPFHHGTSINHTSYLNTQLSPP